LRPGFRPEERPISSGGLAAGDHCLDGNQDVDAIVAAIELKPGSTIGPDLAASLEGLIRGRDLGDRVSTLDARATIATTRNRILRKPERAESISRLAAIARPVLQPRRMPVSEHLAAARWNRGLQ
jgi:hypothetical protein